MTAARRRSPARCPDPQRMTCAGNGFRPPAPGAQANRQQAAPPCDKPGQETAFMFHDNPLARHSRAGGNPDPAQRGPRHALLWCAWVPAFAGTTRTHAESGLELLKNPPGIVARPCQARTVCALPCRCAGLCRRLLGFGAIGGKTLPLTPQAGQCQKNTFERKLPALAAVHIQPLAVTLHQGARHVGVRRCSGSGRAVAPRSAGPGRSGWERPRTVSRRNSQRGGVAMQGRRFWGRARPAVPAADSCK